MLIKGLYSIQAFEQVGETVTATIKLFKEHEIFKGHFPGNPVMPGVCMIQIIKELTEKHIKKELFMASASNIKFMAIINPDKNDILTLTLAISEEDDQIKVKNTSSFDETLALKLNATFKIID